MDQCGDNVFQVLIRFNNVPTFFPWTVCLLRPTVEAENRLSMSFVASESPTNGGSSRRAQKFSPFLGKCEFSIAGYHYLKRMDGGMSDQSCMQKLPALAHGMVGMSIGNA